MYIYIKSEPNLWTVGFYNPKNEWIPESDWSSSDEAATRVHYLNGGSAKLINYCGNDEIANAIADDAGR